ncbi:DNA alkylation repair protein [Mesorhizobium sp. 10J20-29]
MGSEKNRQGMRRYGIRVELAVGVSHGVLRQVARRIRRNHERAFDLWAGGIREAQFIAAMTADPERFTKENARAWAADFDSWDIVDGVSDLFVDTDHWQTLIQEYAADDREFVRRAAFAMIALSTVHRKQEPEAVFLDFLPLIEQHATEPRNFVRKAVNWALRSIGKRSQTLNAAALETARRLADSADKTSRWNGKDAIRELTAEKTLAGIARREASRRVGR